MLSLNQILDSIEYELNRDLSPCGPAPLSILKSCLTFVLSSTSPQSSTSRIFTVPQIQSRLSDLIHFTNEKFYSFPYSELPACWRRLYTDTVILKACINLMDQTSEIDQVGERLELESDASSSKGKRKAQETELQSTSTCLSLNSSYLESIKSLDLALIIAGAPGENRKEFIYHLIRLLQTKLSSSPSHLDDSSRKRIRISNHSSNFKSNQQEKFEENDLHHQHKIDLETKLQETRSSQRIPILEKPPSMIKFQSIYSKNPFIIRGFAKVWPALDPYPTSNQDQDEKTSSSLGSKTLNGRSKWSCSDYLTSPSISGPGRVVPVEIGEKYTDQDWKQEIIGWDSFLERIGWDENQDDEQEGNEIKEPVYLAQHTLLTQFPNLIKDMIIPDYLYSCPVSNGDDDDYQPPVDDEPIISVWIGGENTYSPAHTDPYFNCYVQVVGNKQVWIAPPSCNQRGAMSTFGTSSNKDEDEDGEEPESSGASNYMKNTSKIDIFNKSQELKDDSMFKEDVESIAMTEVLNPGDLLFFPPRWFHGMRSLTKSFSVSMWF